MNLTRPLPILFLLLLLAGIGFYHHRAGGAESALSRSRILMGTVVEIRAFGADRKVLERGIAAAFAEMDRIEELMSPHRPGSDLRRLAEGPSPVPISPETAEVIARGLEVAQASGGAFDLALGRLIALWGMETDAPRVPEPGPIEAALTGIGPTALRLEDGIVVKGDPALQVDLGGIAKGYAIDRAIAALQQAGIGSASVNAGGDLRLLGDHQGRPWRIGVDDPRRSGQVLALLTLADTAVATSGDYQRFFEKDGRRYHHLFDPRTGYPASLSRSATVVGPSATLADALATAVFVLGPEAGLQLLERFPGYEGLAVGADGVLQVSERLRPYLELR